MGLLWSLQQYVNLRDYHFMIRPDVSMGEQGVLLVGVEEGEVLHDDGHQQVQHDVRDDQVERTEEQQSSWKRDLI